MPANFENSAVPTGLEKVSFHSNPKERQCQIMASGPITSWQIGGETMETVADLIFGGSKITADGDCSHLKILQETGIPDHLTCLLRNLYAGQEATVRTEHGTTDCFQIRKGVCQG